MFSLKKKALRDIERELSMYPSEVFEDKKEDDDDYSNKNDLG